MIESEGSIINPINIRGSTMNIKSLATTVGLTLPLSLCAITTSAIAAPSG